MEHLLYIDFFIGVWCVFNYTDFLIDIWCTFEAPRGFHSVHVPNGGAACATGFRQVCPGEREASSGSRAGGGEAGWAVGLAEFSCAA